MKDKKKKRVIDPERMLETANRFIRDNRDAVNPRYRPKFHAVAPIGWINDPNGFFFDGEWYHLFYQHYPYEAHWNDMHWGHWRSRDLAVWEDMPVAMAPDKPYDDFGCFSGTALPDGRGGADILYTGVTEDGKLQQQCAARFDGTTLRKSDKNPVMPFTLLPPGYVAKDFRDPKLFRTVDGYRAVMAAKHKDGSGLVCFSSPDLETWRFEGPFCRTDSLMPECPDVFPLGERTVVLYSKIGKTVSPEINPRPVLYSVGQCNAAETAFTGGPWKPLDHGREFYATQTCEGAGGERIAVSWMASWNTKYPTSLLDHGWCGMMSLPRVLTLRGGRVVQAPAPGLKNLRKARTGLSVDLENDRMALRGVHARHAEIRFRADAARADSVTLNVMEDGNEKVSLVWRDGVLTLDRSATAYNKKGKFVPTVSMPLKARNGKLDMTVYVDNCSVEVFANGEALSALAFPKGEAYDVSVAAEGRAAVEVDCWQLG